MKALLGWLCIIFSTIGVVTVALILVILTHELSGDVIYNCELAEIHPDVPTEIKQECRRLRSKNLTTV